MVKKLLITASTFNSELLTPTEENAERMRDELKGQGKITVSDPCDGGNGKVMTPEWLDGANMVIADLENYTEALLSEVGAGIGGPLELIARYGIGYDRVDLEAATEYGVIVANGPDCNTMSTAERAVGAIYYLTGQFGLQNQRASIGLGKIGTSNLDISGRTLGVVGLGNIAKRVVELMSGSRSRGMKVIAHDPNHDDVWAKANGVKYVSEEELYSRAHMITIHADPQPPKQIVTKDLIDLMQPTAVLVNCARGYLVDQKAIHDAVKLGFSSNHSKGAYGYFQDDAWDPVFRDKNGRIYFLSFDNLNMGASSHVGSDAPSGIRGMRDKSMIAVYHLVNEIRPAAVVNPDVFTRHPDLYKHLKVRKS
ncbi:MAG: NAD(P)-dependent oxidoreductase [Nanoarchaeota archaeon]|nr:NAD(P)-dependent oxidoreductase [Nanoarchaeota archaeon]